MGNELLRQRVSVDPFKALRCCELSDVVPNLIIASRQARCARTRAGEGFRSSSSFISLSLFLCPDFVDEVFAQVFPDLFPHLAVDPVSGQVACRFLHLYALFVAFPFSPFFRLAKRHRARCPHAPYHGLEDHLRHLRVVVEVGLHALKIKPDQRHQRIWAFFGP